MLFTAIASVFLLRHLGVVDFGRFITVLSLISIATILSDAGLTTIGQREYVLLKDADERRKLLANLLAIRLLIAPVGAALAIGFTVIAGYPSVMVWGTVLASVGFMIFMAQATFTVPLAVELRLVALTSTEVIRQFVGVICYGILVIAGASLLPFLAVQIPAALASLALTMILVRRMSMIGPQVDRKLCRSLLGKSLPLAVALAMNVLYFRLLVIMMSLLATGFETGIFATSFRILEVLIGIPVLMIVTALPVLSRAHEEGGDRLRYVLQLMTETALIGSIYLTLIVVITAGPIVEILGGSSYHDAVPVLQIQAFALLGTFMTQVWQLGLIAMHRQALLIISNTAALIVVLILGYVLIKSNGAIGAAYTTIVGEVVIAAATLFMLTRKIPNMLPGMLFTIKVAAASIIAGATILLPGIMPVINAVVATLVFWGTVLLLGAIPREALQAFIKQKRETIPKVLS